MEDLAASGLGEEAAPRLGAGSAPAVLVVDFARGWTDSSSPIALDAEAELAATAGLVAAAHAADAPVVFTTVSYVPGTDQPILLLKAPGVSCMVPGSPWVEIDPRLDAGKGDRVLEKPHASAFFGTDLDGWLRERGVDTLIVAGCVTSGCVRASVVDAAQHGFRPLVVREAVADRSPAAHVANLIDIDRRYGDVIGVEEGLAILSGSRA